MDDSLKDPPLPTFKSIEEECAYWKDRCAEIKHKLIDTRQEFTDFEENSRELEAELEATLEQREKQIRDLKSSLSQIQNDNESLRVSYNKLVKNDIAKCETNLKFVIFVSEKNFNI